MKSITAFLAGLVVAAPLAAQSIMPRERPATADREGTFSGDIARKVMDQFAACVLDRRRKRVLQALALPPDSPEQNKLFGGLAKTACTADTQLQFNGPSFRGSLYKALVRKDFGRKEVFPAPAAGAEAQQATTLGKSARFLSETGPVNFASCVVHKDPENARDAILASAGSQVEADALAALSKVYGKCLYEDESLRFSKGMLIGLLAEAYYREGSASVEIAAAK